MNKSSEEFNEEVEKGQRFKFGENWKYFLSKLNDERIKVAETWLAEMLSTDDLTGKSFLDAGSGSGLVSLAAKNMGASVVSFDFDDSAVWCTSELKKRYYASDDGWIVLQGSVLDRKFLASLGTHDVVYSWGVLHHTGKMWAAIDSSANLVKKGGHYYIAIYNDHGFWSHMWWMVKWFFHRLPGFLRKPYAYSLGLAFHFLSLVVKTMQGKGREKLRGIFKYEQMRGMDLLTDLVDWYGGFPYEFAKYDTLVEYVENKGFRLVKGREAKNADNHELVFVKDSKARKNG